MRTENGWGITVARRRKQKEKKKEIRDRAKSADKARSRTKSLNGAERAEERGFLTSLPLTARKRGKPRNLLGPSKEGGRNCPRRDVKRESDYDPS